MTAQELLKEGKPAEALAALQAEVRAAPNDGKLRVFLFQLLAVLGQWERAVTASACMPPTRAARDPQRRRLS